MVAFFVDFAGKLGDLLLLQGGCQGVQCVDAFEVGACTLGVLAHPLGQPCSRLKGGRWQGILQRDLGVAAKVEGGGHEIKRALASARARFGGGICHGSTKPAARSMRQVRIKGSPMRAVGSSLWMASSSAMPRPSLLALPAQS
ncbi:hypothetical protein D3C71_1238060 [compost metagenome]